MLRGPRFAPFWGKNEMKVREAQAHSHTVIVLLSALVGVLAAFLVLYGYQATAAPPVTGPTTNVVQLDKTFPQVAEATKPAVVSIFTKSVPQQQPQAEVPEELKPFFRHFGMPGTPGMPGEGGEPGTPMPGHALGSGWVYSEDGYIVTNAHVVKDATDVRVRLYDRPDDDHQYEAKVIGSDPRTELALLKIDAGRKLPTLRVGDSRALKVGEWVMAVGSPFELEQTVTVGVVSAKGRMIDSGDERFRMGDIVQTDASINPGNSGGPLVDLEGEVIGVNVAIVAPGAPGNVGIGFAIPAATVDQVVPRLKAEGKVVRGWLGVTIRDLDGNLRDAYGAPEGGALIETIREDGPAKGSGLKEEDVVVGVDGETVKDSWALQQAVANHRPGEDLKLDVVRNHKRETVVVRLAETPASFASAPSAESAPDKAAGSALGMSLAPITPEVAQANHLPEKQGVYVAKIAPDSVARDSGLQPGDVIRKVNRTDVSKVEDVTKTIDEARQNHDKFVILRVERQDGAGERQMITIDIELPA